MNKCLILFDMDGVLAQFNKDASIEELTTKGYFRNLPTHENVIKAVKELIYDGTHEIGICSSVFRDEHSADDKRAWLKQHIPELKEENIYFIPYGEKKEISTVPYPTVLIDDFTPNLRTWDGIGIKMYNGINGTKGTWDGLSVHSNMKPNMLKNQIIGILSNEEITKEYSKNHTLKELSNDEKLNIIKEVAKEIRLKFEQKYGIETNLCGKCIEASDSIVNALNSRGIIAKAIEGWCVYEDDSSCTNRCYDEHTWVEVGDIYVDITADQFNSCMFNELDGIIIGEKPNCMVIEKPTFTWLDDVKESILEIKTLELKARPKANNDMAVKPNKPIVNQGTTKPMKPLSNDKNIDIQR